MNIIWANSCYLPLTTVVIQSVLSVIMIAESASFNHFVCLESCWSLKVIIEIRQETSDIICKSVFVKVKTIDVGHYLLQAVHPFTLLLAIPKFFG